MSFATRFKANVLAGSAFSSDKIKKGVPVKSKDDKSVEHKTVINWDAIFLEPNTAQGVVAMAIMAPLAVLAAPLVGGIAFAYIWATVETGEEKDKKYVRPFAAGLATAIVWPLVLHVFVAFVAIRLVVTPFTELANLVRSAYTAATSKGSDTAKPPKYDAKQIYSKTVDIAKHVWTLGLLLLVPAIKKLVTLDGQIESLNDQIKSLNNQFAAVYAKRVKLFQRDGELKSDKEVASADEKFGEKLNEIKLKREAKEKARAKKMAAKAEGKASAKSSKKSGSPSSVGASPEASAPSVVEGFDAALSAAPALTHAKHKGCYGKKAAKSSVDAAPSEDAAPVAKKGCYKPKAKKLSA